MIGNFVISSGPAANGFAVTPSDSVALSVEVRGLYLGTAGDLTVTLAGDTASLTFKNAPAGYHPLACQMVWATGTTASQIVGLY